MVEETTEITGTGPESQLESPQEESAQLEETQVAKVASPVEVAGQDAKAVFLPESGSELDKLKAELKTIKNQRVEMAIELKAKEQEVNKLKAQLNVKDDEVRLKFNRKDDEIELLQGQLKEALANNEALKAQVEEEQKKSVEKYVKKDT